MMWLRAIRLKDVGCFDTAVALEGLGDGLNVLAGRNELGKSTLLQALRVVFEFDYTSGHAKVRNLVPYSGGAPLIEVDFETSEGRWRLHKQFVSGRMAKLANLDDPAKSVRDKDVQLRLGELLKGPSDLERFKILWVDQSDTLKDIAPGLIGAGASTLVANEIDALATDPDMRRVHAEVRRRLGELQSETGRTKKGRLKEAHEAYAVLTKDLAFAAQRKHEQTARLDQLADLVAQRAQLSGADGIAALAKLRDDTARRLTDADSTQRQEREARQKLDSVQVQLKLAQQTAAAIKRTDTELAVADKGVAEAVTALAALDDVEKAARVDLAVAEHAVTQHQARVRDLHIACVTARQAEAACRALVERIRLTTTLAEAHSALADRAQATAALAALSGITLASVDELEAAIKDRDKRDAQIEGLAPEVTIQLAPGAAGRVHVDDRPLPADAVFNPTAPLDIVIDGIIRIRIAPNPAVANDVARAERIAAHESVERLLAQFGAESLDDARQRFARRQEAERRRQDAGARFTLLAPNGFDALSAALAALDPIAAETSPPSRPSAELEMELDAARRQLDDTERKRDFVRTALARHEQTRAAIVSGRAVHDTRAQDIRTARGGDGEADARQITAAAALASASDAFADATLAHTVFRDKLAALALPELQGAVMAAENRFADAQTRLRQLELDIKGIESALAVARDDDIEAVHTRLTDVTAIARRRLADIEDERAALLLLHLEFESTAAAGRDQIAAPVRARILPFLARVLPGAALTLDQDFTPAALQRGANTEILERLSQGTREQIAIITRLGLGKLLAERGAAVPLILDDALVFSDDERIEAMFDALATAARDHQVIIFTCRTRAFSALSSKPGTTTLSLAPWRPQQVV